VRIFFLCFLAIIVLAATPARAEETLEKEVAKEVRKRPWDDIVTLVYENDMVGGGTDQAYTSGIRFSYVDLNSEFPDFIHRMARAIPSFDLNDTSSVYYSIGQNLFTPEDITLTIQDPNDRPWAAFLYASIGMATHTDNHTDEIEATLGVVGPAALGEPMQKFIHKHITDSPTPMGWDNQLENEPALMLGWQRSWPRYRTARIRGVDAVLTPYYGLTLGNVYTYGDAGLGFRIGPADDSWQDTPLRVRPAMPGTGFFDIPQKKWSWYFFGGIEARAMARNIFLDGNTFRDSHDVDKKFLVGDINGGFAVTYDRMRLSYTLVYRTKEFQTQSNPEVFGAVSLGYRF
jgi:lipid A 3-O-deacylase